jgi:hypothetical protein
MSDLTPLERLQAVVDDMANVEDDALASDIGDDRDA